MRTRARSMPRKPSLLLRNQEEELNCTDSDINFLQLLFALASDRITEAEFQRTTPFRGTLWVLQRQLNRVAPSLG
jgi:hypothetical protein